MPNDAKKKLADALREAGLTELDDAQLKAAVGGSCSESCVSGCSKCCSTGTANRKPDY